MGLIPTDKEDVEPTPKPAYYLVHLDGDDFGELEYAERYCLFTDKDQALKWAREHGYDNMWTFSDKIGMLNTYACEDKHIGIIRLAVDG